MNFGCRLAEGQKTGWFFDQAANRRALPKYVRKGARVLDVFSYVGAWGVRAAHGGAREVTLRRQFRGGARAGGGERRAQSASRSPTRKGDAFDVLEALAKEGARFDVVIIDPPAFAKRKKDLPKALAAYKRLNQLAMQLLADDGILVSCSCSYHVSAEELQDAIAKAARGADKHLQILEMGGQAPDHPVHPAIPGDPISQSLFLSGQRQFKVARMLTYPHINPIAISIGPVFGIGPLRVHWYGIMYLIGFVGGLVAGAISRAAPGLDLDARSTSMTSFSTAPSASSSAAGVGWCIFYGHDVIAENWLNVFHIWDGGMSFHGGMTGVLVAAHRVRARQAQANSPMCWISWRRCRASACWPAGSAISSTANCGASRRICPGDSACRTPTAC